MRLREQGYEDTPSGRRAALGCGAGWGEALTLLKFHVEHGLRYLTGRPEPPSWEKPVH